MVGAALLGALLLVATYTDVRWRIIHNATTYGGIATAWAASAWATWAGVDSGAGSPAEVARWGLPPLWDSLIGCLVCGAMMLVCYLFFARELGGGDVKLIAMIGCFLGPYGGLEAMLWTMVIGGVMALVILVWRVGAVRLAGILGRYLTAAASGRRPELLEDERAVMKTDLFLSPSALLAVVIVRGWSG
ncbi:MAG: A24 family peptidase [Pirellulales bacterium]